jgi:hypothetical protein
MTRKFILKTEQGPGLIPSCRRERPSVHGKVATGQTDFVTSDTWDQFSCVGKQLKVTVICSCACYNGRLCSLVVRVPGCISRGPGGSGTGSTQPHEYNWEATWKKRSCSGLENREYGRRETAAVTTRHPLSSKVGSYFASLVHYVGTIRSRTKAKEFSFILVYMLQHCYLDCNPHSLVLF